MSRYTLEQLCAGGAR